jgi:hypothetical protein
MVPADLGRARGCELARSFAAAMHRSVDCRRLCGHLTFGPFARGAKVYDVAHSSTRRGRSRVIFPGICFGAKCAHSMAARAGIDSCKTILAS